MLADEVIDSGRTIGAFAAMLRRDYKLTVVTACLAASTGADPAPDFAADRMDDLPELVLHTRATPSPANPLGVKGCGEAGAAGGCPAVMNALADALAARKVGWIDMPATPETVWRALHAA